MYTSVKGSAFFHGWACLPIGTVDLDAQAQEDHAKQNDPAGGIEDVSVNVPAHVFADMPMV